MASDRRRADVPAYLANTFDTAAYGGDGWSQRAANHREEIGDVWDAGGNDSEWAPMRAVLLHGPGDELDGNEDHNAVQMLAPIDAAKARAQHDAIAEAYRSEGVAVHALEPEQPARANQMFCADLVLLTPEGAILARPASTVRAGEERQVARRLAELGIPILRTLTGTATFEGADAMWLDPKTVLIGRGLRTNAAGADQVAATLAEIGVNAIIADMPYGTMHLMGMLRIADRDLAIAWPRRTPFSAVEALRARGYQVAFLPSGDDAVVNRALNFVTLSPRKILMVAGVPLVQDFYEDLGVTCVTVEADELVKAAGAIGCLSGVLHRAPAS